MLKSVQLRRLLSFGPETPPVELGPLNILIGPNGSGKSNFIDAITLLQGAPKDLAAVLRAGGGVVEWLWKGPNKGPAEIEVVVSGEGAFDLEDLRHRFVFEIPEYQHHAEIIDESVVELWPSDPQVYYSQHQFRVSPEKARHWHLDQKRSILAQPPPGVENDETLWFLIRVYQEIRVYRTWSFGREAAPRRPQPADLPTDHLLEDASNLALILNGIRLDPRAKAGLLESLRRLYENVVDFHVHIQGGTVQLFLDEGEQMIPATRLSDGTLRWLSLLAVFFNPNPAPLVCIEEPELGLHPDLIPELARLLRQASERMQLIITTHSPGLVDAFSDSPEVVLICERSRTSTTILRLERKALAEWLKDYSLGELWTKGEIGGARW